MTITPKTSRHPTTGDQVALIVAGTVRDLKQEGFSVVGHAICVIEKDDRRRVFVATIMEEEVKK